MMFVMDKMYEDALLFDFYTESCSQQSRKRSMRKRFCATCHSVKWRRSTASAGRECTIWLSAAERS